MRGFREPNIGALIISNRVWGGIGNIIKAPKLKPQTLNRSGFGVSRLGRGPGPRACFMRVSHMMVNGPEFGGLWFAFWGIANPDPREDPESSSPNLGPYTTYTKGTL